MGILQIRKGLLDSVKSASRGVPADAIVDEGAIGLEERRKFLPK